jgi:phage gp16-like protein
MPKAYRPKGWYIKLINIAKKQLNMDEDLYRQSLTDLTRKNSLRAMTIPDLVMVLEYMKKSGFKVKSAKGNSPKSRSKKEHTMLDKLRQVWIQMHYQGFINNGSEQSLQTWASNQSKRLNKGVPITKLEWMKGNMLYALIEQLKKWHMRLLNEAMPKVYCQVRDLAYAGNLTQDQLDDFRSWSTRMSEAENSHDVISNAYSDFLSILKQHDVTVQK